MHQTSKPPASPASRLGHGGLFQNYQRPVPVEPDQLRNVADMHAKPFELCRQLAFPDTVRWNAADPSQQLIHQQHRRGVVEVEVDCQRLPGHADHLGQHLPTNFSGQVQHESERHEIVKRVVFKRQSLGVGGLKAEVLIVFEAASRVGEHLLGNIAPGHYEPAFTVDIQQPARTARKIQHGTARLEVVVECVLEQCRLCPMHDPPPPTTKPLVIIRVGNGFILVMLLGLVLLSGHVLPPCLFRREADQPPRHGNVQSPRHAEESVETEPCVRSLSQQINF